MNRTEKPFSSYSGYLALTVVVVLAIFAFLLLRGFQPLLAAACVIVAVFLAPGLYMLQPNESAILTLFGQYIGTDRNEGLRWAFPLYRKQRLSLRARNLNAPTLKVNDKRGNPVALEIIHVEDGLGSILHAPDDGG